MRFLAKKTDKNEIDFKSKGEVKLFVSRLKGKEFEVIIREKSDKRSLPQNNAMHLFFELLADNLNSSGWDMRKLLKEGVDIPWTADSVKRMLWIPIQKSMFNKKRTRDLKIDEVGKTHEVLNRHIGKRTGVFVPFPSVEAIIANQEGL